MSGPRNRPAQNMVLMGRIGAAHGIRGEVRIQSFTADPLSIADYGTLTTSKGEEFEISSARLAKNMVIARLKGITGRDSAEKLNGTELFIPRDRLPADGGEDEFYHADLIGLEARLESGVVIGHVLALPNFGADDLIEIGTSSKTAKLYPFTRATVPHIDIVNGYLVIVPPQEIAGEEQ